MSKFQRKKSGLLKCYGYENGQESPGGKITSMIYEEEKNAKLREDLFKLPQSYLIDLIIDNNNKIEKLENEVNQLKEMNNKLRIAYSEVMSKKC